VTTSAAAAAAASATAMGRGRGGSVAEECTRSGWRWEKNKKPREAAEAASDSGEECRSALCRRGVAKRAAEGRGRRGNNAGRPVDRVGVVRSVDGACLHVYIGRRKYCENPSNHSTSAMPTRHEGSSTAICTAVLPKSRTPTVAKEFQIGLYDPAEADFELFCNCCSAGFLGDRLYDDGDAGVHRASREWV